MTPEEIKRLAVIEKRVNEIFKENGLNTTTINFEIVSATRMIEALAYRFPTNFSHWSFGRNFEKEETQYRYTGAGIPYEVVWNFDHPVALLVDTNPFALNVLIIAHVYGHVDFHLSNMLMRHGRSIADVIAEARSAKKRFLEYEKKYGVDEVEKVIEAAMAFQYHQNPDPFADPIPEDESRERLLESERARLNELERKASLSMYPDDSKKLAEEITLAKKRIAYFENHSPPEPEYDILKYVLEKSPKMKKAWVKDIVTVVREQMRALAPNFRTQLLNEGWASYWHINVLHQLVREKVITYTECEEAIVFHEAVTQRSRVRFNVYCIGLAFWKMIEDKYDKGRFGPEWENCKDREERDSWDKKLGLGRKTMIEFRKRLSDRVAIENYFDDDFIRQEEIYIWESYYDETTNEEVFVVVEDRPEVIRQILVQQRTGFGIPSVVVTDGNYDGAGELFLRHFFSGFELDPKYEDGALEKLYYLWERRVHLLTFEIVSRDEETGAIKVKGILHSYSSKGHSMLSVD